MPSGKGTYGSKVGRPKKKIHKTGNQYRKLDEERSSSSGYSGPSSVIKKLKKKRKKENRNIGRRSENWFPFTESHGGQGQGNQGGGIE